MNRLNTQSPRPLFSTLLSFTSAATLLAALALPPFASVASAAGPTSAPATETPTTAVPRRPHGRRTAFVIDLDASGQPSEVTTGISRCAFDPLLFCAVLAPQKLVTVRDGNDVMVQTTSPLIATTVAESPTLFYYLTKPTAMTMQIEIAPVVDPRGRADARPIFKTTFTDPFAAGIQRIDLARSGVKLDAGTVYQWSVAIKSPANESEDFVAKGMIKRIATTPELARSLSANADPVARAYALLRAHVFYDALSSVSELIDQAPLGGDEQDQYRTMREQLLQEVKPPYVKMPYIPAPKTPISGSIYFDRWITGDYLTK